MISSAATRQILRRAHSWLHQRSPVLAVASTAPNYNLSPCRISTNFSTEAAAVDKGPPVFQHPKAEALFQKIVEKVPENELPLLVVAVNEIIHKPFREREFYYKGIGGKSFKGGSSAGGAEDSDAPAQEEKTAFDVRLVGFDAKAKIKVIKEVRAVAGLGLKEAKELVENAPKPVQTGMTKEAAEELQKKLEEVGAQVEIV